jgi:hypothetical protein
LDAKNNLTKPIVVNGISVSNNVFNFVTFQLNTFNLKESEGVKNIAYYDFGNEIYFDRPNISTLPYPTRKNIQKYALTKLNYNPQVFKKICSIIN